MGATVHEECDENVPVGHLLVEDLVIERILGLLDCLHHMCVPNVFALNVDISAMGLVAAMVLVAAMSLMYASLSHACHHGRHRAPALDCERVALQASHDRAKERVSCVGRRSVAHDQTCAYRVIRRLDEHAVSLGRGGAVRAKRV